MPPKQAPPRPIDPNPLADGSIYRSVGLIFFYFSKIFFKNLFLYGKNIWANRRNGSRPIRRKKSAPGGETTRKRAGHSREWTESGARHWTAPAGRLLPAFENQRGISFAMEGPAGRRTACAGSLMDRFSAPAQRIGRRGRRQAI